ILPRGASLSGEPGIAREGLSVLPGVSGQREFGVGALAEGRFYSQTARGKDLLMMLRRNANAMILDPKDHLAILALDTRRTRCSYGVDVYSSGQLWRSIVPGHRQYTSGRYPGQ